MQLKFRRKQYNSSTDSADGIVVFDTTTKEIYVGGEEFGHFATMEATGNIAANSTAQQLPTAAAVYEYVNDALEDHETFAVAYANELIAQGITIPINNIPSMLFCPEVILDTESTSVTLDPIKENAVYIYRQPLTNLSINSIVSSTLETTVYFSTHTTTTFSYNFPQGMYKATMIKFDKGCNYCMSIKDNVVVLEKVETYIANSVFLFSSNQLVDGVLKSSPTIVEVNGTTPTVSTTLPYTIYKFGEVTSITMNNIPANTLETIVYFEAGSTPVNLNLYAAVADTLKISAGSIINLMDGKFCMTIKDGVVVISQLKEI